MHNIHIRRIDGYLIYLESIVITVSCEIWTGFLRVGRRQLNSCLVISRVLLHLTWSVDPLLGKDTEKTRIKLVCDNDATRGGGLAGCA